MDNFRNLLPTLNSEISEQALTHGIYNAVALGILCLVVAASYGLYIILSPFFKPLIWALLCGSVLFPLKLSLSTMLQSWFSTIEKSNQPILVHLLVLPLNVLDYCSESIGAFFQKWKWEHVKYFVAAVFLGMASSTLYSYTPGVVTALIWNFFTLLHAVVNFCSEMSNFYVLCTVITLYLGVLYFHWSPENSSLFRYLAWGIWFLITLHVSKVLGFYPVFTFFAILVLLLAGFIYEVILTVERAGNTHMSLTEILRCTLHNQDIIQEMKPDVEEKEASKTVHQVTKVKPSERPLMKSASIDANSEKWLRNLPVGYPRPGFRSMFAEYKLLRKLRELRMAPDTDSERVDTSIYMYGSMYLCVGMFLWKYKWLLPILAGPAVLYLVKAAGCRFGVWNVLASWINGLFVVIKSWCLVRHQALIPVAVQGLYKFSIIANQKLTFVLKSSIDAVSTIAVILGLIIFTICASTFIVFQIYGEGLHLLQVTGQLLNSTVMNNPDVDWVSKQWEDSINNVLDNAYTYGRDAISNGMKNLMKDFEPAKAEQLEKKVVELWDRLYQAWMMSADNPDLIGPTVDSQAALSVWESFRDSFEKIPNNFLNFTNVKNFAQENIGILTQILDSTWSIIKSNASIVISILTDSLYLVLISGSVVFNFILNTIVFFTALFYLLSSSGNTYKPVEVLTSSSPISCHSFAIALQEVVIGVFTATFKLASFFGMWTWFVHNLFQVKVVYLPSFFATVLGAVPFLDVYFACIPATIELWLTRGPVISIIFFMFHFLPCNIVVTDFYKEMKGGGHPYLTGLSIVGGLFCLGVEGVIFGPLLLCCIIVAFNLSKRYLVPPSEETLHNLSSQLDQLRSN